MPNYQPGNLKRGIKSIYKRFNGLLKKRRNKKPLFPNLVGAMCVLEAPLARDRTWNVHLNVLLVHRGFLDWRSMQEAWKWGCHFERIKGGREELERALREVIKYAARAVAEKSCHDGERTDGSGDPRPARSESWSAGASASGSIGTEPSDAAASVVGGPPPAEVPLSVAPAMCDWTGQELLEWISAFRGFRRTRTYKQLFRLAKPEPDSLTGYLWVGTGKWLEAGYRTEVGPLFSIPGDKSTTPDALQRWLKSLSRLVPRPPPPTKCERFA